MQQRDGDGRTALVTGASAGIGEAFAAHLAACGYGLVLTARRENRLQALANRLRAAHGVTVAGMVADLAESDAVPRLVAALDARGIAVDLLVNNAGYGLAGRYLDADWTRHAACLQVLVVAVAELTHRLLPGMVARGWGRVINVASLAGHLPAPAGHTLYAASKAFLVRFSEALDAEYRGRGVFTTAVCPGFTHSEFHDVLGTRDRVSRLPRFMWLDADTVAVHGYAAVMAGNPVAITGRVNRWIAWTMRHVPPATARALVARTGGRFRKTD